MSTPTASAKSGSTPPSDAKPLSGGWRETNEAVRDFHRDLEAHDATPSRKPPRHGSTDTLMQFRLHPEIGTASDLAKPGGFRRAHVLAEASANREPSSSYARTSLVSHLALRDPILFTFVTDVIRTLPDGTELRYRSRAYRLGLRPEVLRLPSGPRRRLVWCGFRPTSVPYWVSVSFLAGDVLFAAGSFCWMAPSLGDVARGAPDWTAALLVQYPFFVGSLLFTVGCYLALVEVVNANFQVELDALSDEGSIHRRRSREALEARSRSGSFGAALSARLLPAAVAPAAAPPAAPASRRGEFSAALRWWGWQPSSLLYWGALGQLVGAFAFNVACAAGLPANAVGVSTHAGEVAFLYLPSLLGSALFVFASYVYVVEETHDYNCFVVPAAPTLGYAVVSLNLLGSLLFLVASAGYFCQVEPYGLYAGGQFGWEWQISEWGVRFTYGVGSLCFVGGALVSFPELLSDI